MPREIKVAIGKDGTTVTDFSGFAGPSCLDAAEQLRKILAERFGIEVTETNFVAKPELEQAGQQPEQERRAQREQH